MPAGVGYPPDWVPGQNFQDVGGSLVDTDGDGVGDRETGAQRVPLAGPDPVLADFQAQREGRSLPELGAPPPAPAPQLPSLADAAKAGLGKIVQGVGAASRAVQGAGSAVRQGTQGTELGIQGEHDLAAFDQQRANEGVVAADRAEAAAEGLSATRKKSQMEAHETKVRTIVADRDREVGDQLAKVQRLSDQARNTKINPNALWQDANVAKKASMVLGVVLGGALIPTAGRNPGMDIIDRQIQRNIDAQKANLDNLQQGVQNEQSILGELRQQYGDQVAAESAFHAIALDQIANELDGRLAGIKDQRALARGMELSAKLREDAAAKQLAAMERERAHAQQGWENKYKGAVLAEQRAERRQRGYIAGRELTLKEMEIGLTAAQNQAKAKAEADGESRWFRSIQNGQGEDGHSIRVSNPTERERFSATVGGSEGTLDAVATIKDVIDNTGRAEFWESESPIVQSAMAKILLSAAADVKGNPSDKDMQIVLNRAGGGTNPATWDPRQTWGRLSVGERKKVLDYVSREYSDGTDRVVKSFTGGKAAFKYKGVSLLGGETKVKPPSFSEARASFLKGEAGPEIFLGDRAVKGAAISPPKLKQGLAALAERTSQLDKDLKAAKTPGEKHAIRTERRKVGEVAAELQKRAEDAKVKPEPLRQALPSTRLQGF